MPVAVDSERGFFRAAHRRLSEALSAQQVDEFAALGSDEQRFQWLWDQRLAHETPCSFTELGKDLEQAKQFKDDGNKAFQKEDYATAVRLYTKSILHMPVDSGDLSVVHANRSAALYHRGQYHLALQDIEQALELGYPKHLLYKVYDRQARCLLALKQHLSAKDTFQRTISALDDSPLTLERRRKWQMDVQIMVSMFTKFKDIRDEPLSPAQIGQPKAPPAPGRLLRGPHPRQRAHGRGLVSAALRFHEALDEEVGRHVTTDDDVKAGDLLLTERPAVAVLLQERALTHCFECFRRLRAPVACPRCSAVLFCSAACRTQAERTHHAVECSVLPLLWASGASITCLMALRAIAQLPKGAAPPASVMSLVTHTARRQTEDLLHRAHMAVFLARCLQAAGHAGEGDEVLRTGGRLLTLLQLLQFNVHEVSELELKVPPPRGYDSATSNFVGAALYPTLALFNHSCDPGVVRYFNGTTVVVHAARGLRAGQPVCENYGFCYSNRPRQERLDALQRQYWFRCCCQACEEDWPLLRDMENDTGVMRFRCDPGGASTARCSNVIIVPTDTTNFMVQCSACKQHTNILKGLKALQDTDSMLKIAQSLLSEGNLTDALDRFLKILSLLEDTLVPPFKDYTLCQDKIRMCMVALGEDVIVSGTS
ncbi:SET and MYND domain-containing protein 4-like [Frankliniella occidentalis]|uniref:Protein-lysine N-methyltransferase SMYD4 n=1 Tax=Frankliniella occidentalis TaxID=133901 RepID=A0A6J1SI80_FRAOC|nr:SET and MYND domain-containing protein 4 [Frankliniella occidentalis]XP_052123346.1 SET and MYND domain-containing protein 4-like [Frankliniella occidentalis]